MVGYHTKPGTEMLIVPGMTFTIEPMVNAGTERIYTESDNGMESTHLDGEPSAQWISGCCDRRRRGGLS